MARITVEDCSDKIPNHFDLTLAALRRWWKMCVTTNPPLPPCAKSPPAKLQPTS